MSPATIVLILSLVEEAIKVAPEVAAGIKAIFAKGDPTPEDWSTLRALVLSKTYKDYVPKTQLD